MGELSMPVRKRILGTRWQQAQQAKQQAQQAPPRTRRGWAAASAGPGRR